MIFFAKISSNRRKNFQIITTLEVDNLGNKFSVKKAYNADSREYINDLYKKYKNITSKNPETGFSFANTKLKDGKLVTEYLDHTSASKIFSDSFSKNDKSYLKIVDKVVDTVEEMPTLDDFKTESQKKAYKHVFGDSFTDCNNLVDFGYFDLTLENILVDDAGKLFLIDYEWIFDFPLPKTLLVGRLIYYSFKQLNIPPSDSSMEIEGVNIPKDVYEKYKQYLEKSKVIMSAEKSFHEYVGTGTESIKTSSIKSAPNSSLEKKLNTYKDRVHELEGELLDSGKRSWVLEKDNALLKKQIQKLESSKTANVQRRLATFLNRFFR